LQAYSLWLALLLRARRLWLAFLLRLPFPLRLAFPLRLWLARLSRLLVAVCPPRAPLRQALERPARKRPAQGR
jgi:hypothetical protein